MPARLFLLLLVLMIPLAAQADSQAAGLIYGTVTWPDGEQLTGFIRWKSEEACWDDLFHCGYRDNPWKDHLDLDKLRAERRREYYENHGLIDRLMYSLHEDDKNPLDWRMFLIRLGDLQRIEIHDGEDDFAVAADGSRHQIGGYGNDAGADLLVYAGQEEPTEIKWNDLASIAFLPVPADAIAYAERLYGTVESTEGTFTGYIQWDVTECLSTDILDARQKGKNRDFPMGDIRSLARAEKKNATVITLKDGTTETLGGSNDVDKGNRGIMVESPEYGRVIIPWKRFFKVTFEEGHGSGPGRETYRNAAPLNGTVILNDGKALTGRLVYDLDEGWHWDLFNGDINDLEYIIPFPLIRRITPLDGETCRVELRTGRTFDLTGTQDTGRKHGGMLVLPPDGGPAVQVAWDEVALIELDP